MKYPFSAPNLQPDVPKSMIFASVGVQIGGVRLRRERLAGDSCLTVGIIADVGQVVGTVVATAVLGQEPLASRPLWVQ